MFWDYLCNRVHWFVLFSYLNTMKLKYVIGCVCDSLSVNDKEFNELPLEERKEVLHHLIEHSTDEYTLQELFIRYIECEGDREISGPCECCGDMIHQYDLER